MIKTIDGIIKSLQIIARHLEYSNDSGYIYSDNYHEIIRAERNERAYGNRPAIISEDADSSLDDDVVKSYVGNKGNDYHRGSI